MNNIIKRLDALKKASGIEVTHSGKNKKGEPIYKAVQKGLIAGQRPLLVYEIHKKAKEALKDVLTGKLHVKAFPYEFPSVTKEWTQDQCIKFRINNLKELSLYLNVTEHTLYNTDNYSQSLSEKIQLFFKLLEIDEAYKSSIKHLSKID